MTARRERVAVIGAGVSGLTAAYILRKDYDVTLFEAGDRLGGHAHTHQIDEPGAGVVDVDTGFIVFNRVTYPNLVRLFDELSVESQPAEMSMSVRCDGCGLEYAGARGPGGVFAQPGSATRRPFLRMLVEVAAFHRRARRHLAGGPEAGAEGGPGDLLTLGQFLDEGGFSEYFRSHFAVPVVASVWSTGPRAALDYPARYLFRFLANHGLLSVRGSHQWYTVSGGSRRYVDAIAKQLGDVRVGCAVEKVSRSPGEGVQIRSDDGTEEFDRAVVATHPDTAARLLSEPSPLEREVLGAFRYSRNQVLLHQDPAVLPRTPRAAAAWNYYMPSCEASADEVAVSYDMNRLQRLPARRRYVVTLNGSDRVDPTRVLARMRYDHPIYTPTAVAAQHDLGRIGDARLAFAGAYHGWGFHEDGCRSGVAAAGALGVRW